MAALQLLATRLLQRDIDPAALPEGDTVQLLPEQLPADVPIELPLPPGARLIGSVLSWPPRETAVVLDVPLSPEAVYAFYGERLLATGWREWTSVKVASGFVDDTPYIWLKHHIHPKFFTPGAPPRHIFYRDGTAPWPPYRAEEVGDPNPGPVLFVHATAVPSKPTEVRLWLVEDAHGIAGMGLTDANPRLLAMLPVLTPPLGAPPLHERRVLGRPGAPVRGSQHEPQPAGRGDDDRRGRRPLQGSTNCRRLALAGRGARRVVGAVEQVGRAGRRRGPSAGRPAGSRHTVVPAIVQSDATDRGSDGDRVRACRALPISVPATVRRRSVRY